MGPVGPALAISGGGGKEKAERESERAESGRSTPTLSLSHHPLIFSFPGDLSEANYKDLTGMSLAGKKLYKAQFRATIFDKAGA